MKSSARSNLLRLVLLLFLPAMLPAQAEKAEKPPVGGNPALQRLVPPPMPVEKIIIQKGWIYALRRMHWDHAGLYIGSLSGKGVYCTRLELPNDGKYAYHPDAWDIVDSFLYAIELRRLDKLFVTPFLIRHTLPGHSIKSIAYTDWECMKKSRRTLAYAQILDLALYEISVRLSKDPRPMFYDMLLDTDGRIVFSILDKTRNKLTVYSKTIAQHEKEQADSIPYYRRIDTWIKLGEWPTGMQSGFRLFRKQNDLYALAAGYPVYRLSGQQLEPAAGATMSGQVVLVVNKDNRTERYIEVGIWERWLRRLLRTQH